MTLACTSTSHAIVCLCVMLTSAVPASSIAALRDLPASPSLRGGRHGLRLPAGGASLQAPRLQDGAHISIRNAPPSKIHARRVPVFDKHHHAPLNVHVYFAAKNEQVLLPLAIQHYRTRFPGCRITVFDNNSTDNTVHIARRAGCEVIHRRTQDDIMDQLGHARLKSECWKTDNATGREPPWVVVADVDEWLDMWQEDLQAEDAKGAVIIRTMGAQVVGNSSSLTLVDLDVHSLAAGAFEKLYSKLVCFKRGPGGIQGITYKPGAHVAMVDPFDARFSSGCYVLKHMSALGYLFYKDKQLNRYWQSLHSRKLGFSQHYSNDTRDIHRRYTDLTQSAKHFPYVPSANGRARIQCSTY